MDFFEQEHRARRGTALIVLMFVVSVVGVVLAVNFVGGYVYLYATHKPLFPMGVALAAVPHSAYAVTTIVVLGIIAWGSLSRIYELSDGGAAVAAMVDARRVNRDSGDPDERRLLNVVEEMALASGISVPQAYVMDGQDSINAFAAGYTHNEAAVVVTQGALTRLNRDELQGVLAHEFSHILNGDMRLNVRLIGVIAGLVLIGTMGAFFMRLGQGGSGSRGNAPLVVLGLALWILGSSGVLAGRLIKAAVAREREFLADASAVQFTRNPDGIGGALFKIVDRGSVVLQRNAEELSHMFIGAPVNDLIEFPWLRTHPPLEERLKRLLGPAALRLLRERQERALAAEAAAGGGPVVQEFVSPLVAKPAPGAMAVAAGAAATLVQSVGNPSAAHMDRARKSLDAIPADVRKASGSEDGARAALFALLLKNGDVRIAQLSLIAKESKPGIAEQSARFADTLRPVAGGVRLPLIGLIVPTLKTLTGEKRDGTLRLVREVIEAGRKVTLGDFVVLTVCSRHLGADPRGAPPVKYKDIAPVAAEAGIVLSLLANAGGSGMAAFDRGMKALGVQGGVFLSPAELKFANVERALYELKLLAPLKKPILVKACVEAAMADARLTPVEGELLYAICSALDTPLPPMLEAAEAAA